VPAQPAPLPALPRPPVAVREAEGVELDRAGEVVAAAYQADGLASERYAVRLRASRERARDGRLVVAVTPAGEVVGTATYALAGSPLAELCRADPEAAEIRMLGVLPAARGRGVAQELLAWCVAAARADGARRVLLSTQADMHAAQRLYGRLGFTRRPDLDWTPEPGVQLLGLQLDLGAPPADRGQTAVWRKVRR
jgi:ribosomal protein S18 acetylase RimI-like enzyme